MVLSEAETRVALHGDQWGAALCVCVWGEVVQAKCKHWWDALLTSRVNTVLLTCSWGAIKVVFVQTPVLGREECWF